MANSDVDEGAAADLLAGGRGLSERESVTCRRTISGAENTNARIRL
jgi:hypothetical protein